MRKNCPHCFDQRKAYKLGLRRTMLIIASFVLIWQVSCVPSVTTPGLVGPKVTLIPTSAVMPEITATMRATAAQTSTASSTLPATTPTQKWPLAIVSQIPDQVGRYELLELEIQSEIVPVNPFDPEELDIRATFISPSGKTMDVGAFWYQEYNATGRSRVGEPGWRVRFTPTEIGNWTAIARIPSRKLESPPVRFTVVVTDRHGFVRIHTTNPRYFALDDGSFFFPIGLNMAWWSGAGDSLTDYRKWMKTFAANGGNTIRVWMAEWSFGLEWNDTPLGDYENRLQRAWYLDQIFNMAEERDMYVLLVLLNCADFNYWQTKGWDGNPYNAANGGPLALPSMFVKDPTARAFLKKRLNYIVNRWGYSPRLLAWEWWNEVNLAPFSDKTLIPWLQEMTAYLRIRDINRHLVTNSYAISDTSPTWRLPEMDIIQKHEYAHQEQTTNKDLAERVTADLATLVGGAPAKPALLGEFGYGTEGYGKDIDKTGIYLHNGIWSTTFAGYAGSGMYWYWDVYVEEYSSWHHFLGLNRFLKGVELSQYQPFSPLIINGPGGKPGQAVGLGLHGDDVLIWLRSKAYTVQAVEAAMKKPGSPSLYTPPVIEGQVLTLRDMQPGTYTVQWFDPQYAKWLESTEVTANGGRITFLIPDFQYDLAARIVLNP